MVISVLASLAIQSTVQADVRIVREFSIDKDSRLAANSFIRLCSRGQVEFPLSVESLDVFHKTRYALSAIATNSFMANLWANGCRPKLSKSKTREYVVNPQGIHCFARANAEILMGYGRLLEHSNDKSEFAFAMKTCSLHLSRLKWSVMIAGTNRLTDFDKYESELTIALAKYPAGTFEANQKECLRRWAATSQSLKEISKKHFR